MNRLLGMVIVLIGAVLLHYGWQSHEAIPPNLAAATNDTPASRSIWLLGIGSVAVVWACLRSSGGG